MLPTNRGFWLAFLLQNAVNRTYNENQAAAMEMCA